MKNKEFVIYISSNSDIDDISNSYGYFAGKCYTRNGEIFPVSDRKITDNTKKYTSNKMAIKGAEAVMNKCAYILSYKIYEI